MRLIAQRELRREIRMEAPLTGGIAS